MITIDSPSMALNDSRAAVRYHMDATKTVQPTTTMREVVNMVLAQAQTLNGRRIENLILTAHGTPGYFEIGTGLSQTTMAPFADVRNRVFKIWFRGCLVARITGPETASHGDGAVLRQFGLNVGNGHAFISAFARLTGCYVVAPTEMQCSRLTSYPQGLMDSYEGLVLCYDPSGNISWQHRYPSLYGYDTQRSTATNPNQE